MTFAAALAAGLPVAAEAPKFGLPLACEPQTTCFIQHYVDVAPEGGTQDFRCGHSTYKGHDGVDFRILSAAAALQGVPVLAAAGGTVLGVRDGMTDSFPRESESVRAEIKGRECGNGVVIDHGDGWQSQYCHLRQGSVRVKAGQRVERGAPLGEVGFSGLADSAHLHLTIRHEGKPIDPFTGRPPDGTCQREGAMAALFEDGVAKAFPYADGLFLQTGFAGRVLTWPELERDHTAGQEIVPASNAIVFFARMMHLRAGDRVRLVVTGPAGFYVDAAGKPIERDQAIYIAHAGKKRTVPRWPAGSYTGNATLIRDGTEILKASGLLTLPE